MSQAVSVQCGMCRRRFKCPPDLHDRQVRCPYCKTVVRIPAPSDAARQAVEAMGDIIAREKADREKRPLTGRAPAPRMMPVRNKNVAIVSLVLVAVGLVAAVIALVIVLGRGKPGGATGGTGILRISKRSLLESSEPRPTPANPDAAQGGGLASAAPPAPPAPMKPLPDPLTVKVERLIGGYKDETVTYAVGRVTNNTTGLLRVVKIIISISDKNDKELGEAAAIILNLPAGEAAPFVAEWQHAEGVIGKKWFPGYEVNPPGVPQELPAITTEEPVPLRDQNAMATTGWIRILVTNQGVLPVPSVMVHALLLSEGGRVVGAARVQVDKNLPPKQQVEIRVPWAQCAGHLVHSAEVWVQPPM